MHGPPHCAPVHCGVGVGGGLVVGGGVNGAQEQPPVASTVHAPRKLGTSKQPPPGTQGGEITHAPPQGTLVHWGVGVGRGGGHCNVHT